jgi:integrase
MSKIVDFQAAVRQLQPDHQLHNPPVKHLVPQWLTDRRSDGRRVRGISSYEDVFLRFLTFAGDIRVRDLDTALVQAYKRERMQQVEASTTRLALTVIRAFCDWAVEKKYLETNPARAVSNPKVLDPDPDPLTSEQVGQLLAVMDQPPRSHKKKWRRNRRAVGLMLYAGLRLAEVAGLEWRDVDLKRRTITVRREIAKGGKSRVLPICDELLDELLATPPTSTNSD